MTVNEAIQYLKRIRKDHGNIQFADLTDYGTYCEVNTALALGVVEVPLEEGGVLKIVSLIDSDFPGTQEVAEGEVCE